MQTYMMVGRDDGAGFNVELTDAIGVHHTMLRDSKPRPRHKMWIEQDQRVSIGAAQATAITSVVQRIAAA